MTAERGATCRCLLRLRRAGPTLIVAFRAETALRRQSWSAALRETFTFPEMALLELINRHFSRPGRACLDWTRNRFYLAEAQSLAQGIREHLAGMPAEWKFATLTSDLEGLLRQELPESARQALNAFDAAVSPVRRYRNVATHACLDESCIAEVQEELKRSGVWPDGRPTRFLDGDPARAVLAAVGQPAAAGLYQELVEAILDDIDRYSFLSS